MQAVLPSIIENDPEGHGMHVINSIIWYLPAKQLETHEAELASEKAPSRHVEQLAAPLLAWYVPAAQPVQMLMPGADEYWPGMQLWHVLELSTGAKVPAEQAEQAEVPVEKA